MVTLNQLSKTLQNSDESENKFEHSSTESLAERTESSGEDNEQDYAFDGQVVPMPDDVVQEIPSFGNVSVVNSNDVHFGNKTFYHGPVTIKQFLYGNNNEAKTAILDKIVDDGREVVANGASKVNNGFVLDESECVSSQQDSDKKCKINNSLSTTHIDSSRSRIYNNGIRRLQKFSQENVFILVTLLIVITLSGFILTSVLLFRHESPAPSSEDDREEESDYINPIDAPLDPNANLTLPEKLRFVGRLEWVAQPPTGVLDALKTPVPYVIIHHTATENCSTQAQCVLHVRKIQQFHIESFGWFDIGYNFLVGGDGEAFVGRGWKSEGAHTLGFNKESIGIAFIGTFMNVKPPNRQIVACKKLINIGVNLGFIRKDYKLFAVRQLSPTQSPGDVLYEDIKTWSHWNSEGPTVPTYTSV